MSEIIKGTFKNIFKVGNFLFNHQVLKSESGARFSNSREEKSIFKISNKGLLINGKDKRSSVKSSLEHLAIIAKSGGGKTVNFIIPALLDQAKHKTSIIVTDPSGEIFNSTSQYMKNKGFKVLTLDPNHPETTCRFNPFDGLGANDIIEIEKICTSLVISKYGVAKDPIWNEGAIAIIEVLAKCLAFSEPDKLNLANINYLIQKFGEDGEDLDGWVAKSSINPLDKNDFSVSNAWLGITRSNKNMLASFKTIAKTTLKSLDNRDMQRFLSHNDIDFNLFRKEKTILYIITPAEDQSYYQFLIDLFYTRFFSKMMKTIPTAHELPIYCLLDEFGGSYINDFTPIITNIRKYKVSLSIVLQSLNQLEEKYNKKADSIKGGIGSYLVFSGADLKTSTELSNVIGKKRITTRKTLTNPEEKYTDRNLINPDEIRTLEDNKALFITKNKYAVILNMTAFFNHRVFSSAVEQGACELTHKNRDNNVYLVDVDI